MLRNYLITAWRNILKSRSFSLINVLGLAIGMAAFMIILIYTSFELSYDDFQSNKNQVYRWKHLVILPGDNSPMENSTKTGPTNAGVLKDNFPEVRETARLMPCPPESHYTTVAYIDEQEERISFNEEYAYYADASFLKMLDFQMLSGDNNPLENPYTVVLSASTAKRYFNAPPDEVIGKIVHIPFLGQDKAQYKITGIYQDLPANSHLRADLLLSYRTLTEFDPIRYEDNWHFALMYTYVQFHPNFSEEQVQQNIDRYNALVNEKYQTEYWSPMALKIDGSFIPLDDIYLRSDSPDEIIPNGNEPAICFLLMIGGLIIIIAWVNYVNLTTAKALQRAREVGVRKAVGANWRQLVSQFFTEAFLLNLFAIALSLIFIWFTLPYFSELTGKILSLHLWMDGMPDPELFFLVLGILAIISTFLSGFYPAFVLSSFQPLKVLRGNLMHTPTGRLSLRSGLVVFQFIISVLLIAGTFLIYRQITFMQKQSLGFDTEQMLVIQSPSDTTLKSGPLEAFKEELARQSFVEAATASSAVPSHQISWRMGVGITLEDRKRGLTISIDHDFLDTYDFQLVAGRSFSEDYTTDQDAIILTETFAKIIGFEHPEDAIGETVWLVVGEKKVIGIVQDYHQAYLKETYQNVYFLMEGTKAAWRDFKTEDRAYVSLKISTENLQQHVAAVQQMYQAYFPGYPFEYFFLDERFNRQYKADIQFGKIFGLFASLAIFIACLGILGLSSYMAIQKSKEIGIRKVNGASVAHIVVLLSGKFVRLVVIALAVGLPVANYVFDTWLENYAFRTEIGWEFFAFPALLIFVITLSTISVQTIKAAQANPVDSLKYE